MKKTLAIYFSVYGTANTTAEEASLHSIALAVFVTNLFMKKSIRKATERYFFVLFFSDGVLQPNEDQFIIIEEGA